MTASQTTLYLGESYELVVGGEATKYVFAGSLRIASVAQSPEPGAPSQLRFYHTDHLGSSNVLTDETGQLVSLTEYTPYGAVALAQSPEPGAQSRIGFTGQRQDTDNGLVLFPARAYDPTLGRFIQADPLVQDPIDPQTLNRYAYVRNNPINLVDPTGLSEENPDNSWDAIIYIFVAIFWGLFGGGKKSRQVTVPILPSPIKFLSPPSLPTSFTSSLASPEVFHGLRLATPDPAQRAQETEQLLAGASNFFGGAGDMLSFGITDRIRKRYGLDSYVDKSSGLYKAGEIAGVGLGLAAGGVGSLNAGSRTVLYSGEGALEIARAGKGAGLLIEQTLGGRLLNGLEVLSRGLFRKELPQTVWDIASGVFAANAKGPVYIFLRNPAARSVYNRIEKPVLDFFKNTVIRYM